MRKLTVGRETDGFLEWLVDRARDRRGRPPRRSTSTTAWAAVKRFCRWLVPARFRVER